MKQTTAEFSRKISKLTWYLGYKDAGQAKLARLQAKANKFTKSKKIAELIENTLNSKYPDLGL